LPPLLHGFKLTAQMQNIDGSLLIVLKRRSGLANRSRLDSILTVLGLLFRGNTRTFGSWWRRTRLLDEVRKPTPLLGFPRRSKAHHGRPHTNTQATSCSCHHGPYTRPLFRGRRQNLEYSIKCQTRHQSGLDCLSQVWRASQRAGFGR
jgi:hypothetical protein